MPINDELGIRMKKYYEEIPKTKLMRRTPVAIRIDGRAFHTFTRGFQKPFDRILIESMQETTKYLCENIQGCVIGYTQSDEITLILIDYKELNTDAWFDYEVQKLCSISASMATMYFNKVFSIKAEREILGDYYSFYHTENSALTEEKEEYHETLRKALKKGAMFDARCFNIPREEVTNLLYWRQLDAARNSVQMVGHANFSQKQLFKKSCSDIQDMLMTEKGINWNNFPTYKKRGTCVVKAKTETGERPKWIIDENIPMFKGEGREYVEELIYADKD